jgi:hypothetical protein
MTNKQNHERALKAIKAYARVHTKTADSARAALIKTGIYDKDGNIKPQFDESLDYKKTA